MGKEQTSEERFAAVDALLESGSIPETADVTEIAALLAAQESGEQPDPKAGEKAAAAAGSDAGKPADGDTANADAAQGGADVNQGGSASTPGQQDEQAGGAIVRENGETIPYAVLQGTREQLKQAKSKLQDLSQEREADKRRIAELQSQLEARQTADSQQTKDVQSAVDAAGVTDSRGNSVDVATVDVSKLRGEFPEEIVNVIEALQNNLRSTQETVRTLQARESGRIQGERQSAAEQLQADIDSIPALATWQAAEDQSMYEAAIAVDSHLRKSPEWADKPRVERFREVVKRLGGQVSSGQQAGGSTHAGTVNEALRQATAKAHPISHSDLPAGSPAAQSEQESLGSLDVTQLAEKMSGMNTKDIDALLARLG